MITCNFSKFFTINAMAMAVVATTALSAKAAIIMDHPNQVSPNTDPAMWNNTTDVRIAYNTGHDVSVILNNADGLKTVHTHRTYIGSANGAVGRLTVDGAGAVWNDHYEFFVGHTGTGELAIQNGGQVVSYMSHIGELAGSSGLAIVDGQGSAWDTNGSLYIGVRGNGELTITNGGLVTSKFGYMLGLSSGGTGTVTVAGTGSLLDTNDLLYVGAGGKGELNIINGGNVNSSEAGIGTLGGSGKVTVDGTGSTWTNDHSMFQVDNGTLDITNGGKVINKTTGDITSKGSVTVNGTSSSWSNSLDLYVNGNLAVQNGGQVNNAAGYIGRNSNATGSVTVDGTDTVWTNRGALYAGYSGSGELTISNGGKVSSTSGYIAYNANSTGKVTVMGDGSIWNATNSISVGYAGEGELHIKKNGSVHVGNRYSQSASGLLELDIGSLGSGSLTVGTDVFLDGILQLTTNGFLDEYFYVLIDNLGSKDVNGTFADIFFNGELVTITSMDDTNGGGSFVIDGIDYYISYAGDSATGSLYGGNDVILSTPGGGGGPAIPEPASLSLLALGAAALIVRRRR